MDCRQVVRSRRNCIVCVKGAGLPYLGVGWAAVLHGGIPVGNLSHMHVGCSQCHVIMDAPSAASLHADVPPHICPLRAASTA